MDARQVIDRCLALAACTEEPGHITRTFLSPPMRQVHQLVRGWMEQAGMAVSVDAVGNLRGVYGPAPRIMLGSHLDTVPHAGAFDGILGVMLGIALVAHQPPCGVEVAAFSEEEGVRFGIPFIGSRALAGDPVLDPAVLQAIRDFGLDPALIPAAALTPDVHAYLEFHIEQGPVLAQQGQPLAVVDRIVGQLRARVRFTGHANHAGTTPMACRRDALAAAAEWISAVESTALKTPGLVATVGRLDVHPGASNVIPGEATATLDVRHSDESILTRAAAELQSQVTAIAGRRCLAADWQILSQQPPVAMNEALVNALCTAGNELPRMASGAGHDAMILAHKLPAAMLFLRSPGGVSHHPDETVLEEDVAAALAVGLKFLENWRPE